MKSLLEPQTAHTHPLRTSFGILALLATSAILLVSGTLAMLDGYSWLSNVISESAGQGVYNAWIARLGFLLFGFAVAWLAFSLRSTWARGAYWMHLAFGIFMVSTAAFSHRPWLPDIAFDPFEDFLHSVTATGMGFAFSLGVLVRLLQRRRHEVLKRLFDVIALASATAMPFVAVLWPAHVGLFQRLMFLLSYLWYANETLLVLRQPGSSSAWTNPD